MIFKKKHIVTSKERKKNGIYILYTQHVFPTFSSFSPTARVIRFPLPSSLPPSPPPLSVYSEAPEGAKRESSQTSQSAVAAIIGKVNSAAIDAIARETPPFHSSLLRGVHILERGEREKKCLSPWRINATPSRRRVHVGFKFRRHTFPLEAINSTWFRWWTRPVFVGLFHHSPPSNPNGNETAPSIPAHATARPIHRGWKQARKSSSTNVEPRCHNGHIAN